MARPTSRTPRTKPAALTPAPDSGVPFASETSPTAKAAASVQDGPETSTRSTGAAARKKGPTRQLGARIPADLYDRLSAASDETGITVSRIIANALEVEIARLENLPK